MTTTTFPCSFISCPPSLSCKSTSPLRLNLPASRAHPRGPVVVVKSVPSVVPANSLSPPAPSGDLWRAAEPPVTLPASHGDLWRVFRASSKGIQLAMVRDEAQSCCFVDFLLLSWSAFLRSTCTLSRAAVASSPLSLLCSHTFPSCVVVCPSCPCVFVVRGSCLSYSLLHL